MVFWQPWDDTWRVTIDCATTMQLCGGRATCLGRSVGTALARLSFQQLRNWTCLISMLQLERESVGVVADELVAEFADSSNNLTSLDQPQYEEKNIRRRVYDALNVLMAMDIVSKDKKEIQWKGLHQTSLDDIEELKAERLGLRGRIEKKTTYLQELEEQHNQQLYSSGNSTSGGVALPFILVQTRPHATVEVEISEDMQLVHFDFNSTPFEIHDDNYVLKAMRFCERPQGDEVVPNFPADGGEGSGMFQPQFTTHPALSNRAR
ncbi:transcription factor DP [Actinidia rufa]|uniref:Transcription factor DP n=1 Tax=Actinidia rufa TaxID=165716 RepID=A0A7J0GY99_9ERIC|nr:transcription factor DP [Actinidia rufa]